MSNSLFTNSMFESIVDALNSEQTTKSKTYEDILSLQVGNKYLVRILPNLKDMGSTFFHYYMHGWNSFKTGKFVSTLSPTTFGQRDVISEKRWTILKHGSVEEKEKIQKVRRTENWLVNVYVVDDPTNKENNGKIKVLRYGKQLDKIIKDAVSGDGKKEFGRKVFDLGPEGVNLLIKVDENDGGYATYTSSRFTSLESDLNLSKDRQLEIYNGIHDLKNIYTLRSDEDMLKLLDEHFYCKEDKTQQKLPDEDNAVMDLTSKTTNTSSQASSLSDDEIESLLKDL